MTGQIDGKLVICRMVRFIPLLIIFCISNIQAQIDTCFEVDRIVPARYEPSNILSEEREPINIILFKVDDSRENTLLQNRLIQSTSPEIKLVENYQLKIDSIMMRFRLAIISNYTDSIILIPAILGRITLIQEAIDSNGYWRPIETSDNNLFCGNTDHGNIELKSNEGIEIYIRNYCGSFDTQLRMKLLSNKGIIISDVYSGSINYEQFNLFKIFNPKEKYFINLSVQEEINRIEKLKQ